MGSVGLNINVAKGTNLLVKQFVSLGQVLWGRDRNVYRFKVGVYDGWMFLLIFF